MRRKSATGLGPRALGGLALLALFAPAVPARAQVPQPFYPMVEQRSGLADRARPVQTTLPPDPYRDTFYGGTRFTDHADFNPNHPNWFRSGGLYGRRWPGYCTASFSPYFFGSPGQSTVGPDCKPWPRYLKGVQTLVHPFRPVCYYYEQGSYVPIYDLDPLAPGPGRVPNWFPFYLKDPHGG